MDLKQKQEMRQVIGSAIDLSGSRLKDDEAILLYDIVTNPAKYNGLTRTVQYAHPDWSSDGRYTRYYTDTYTLHSDGTKALLVKNVKYRDDDDNQTDDYDVLYTKARDILENIGMVFGERRR